MKHFSNRTTAAEMARGPGTPILELLESFVRSRHDLKAQTIRGYQAGMRRFAAQHTDLRDLTAESANEYIRDAVRRKRRFLAHHDGRSLTIFAQWLVEANILSHNPLAGVKVPPQPNTRRKPFKDVDVPLIIRAAEQSGCGERDVAIVVLALATGLRLNELRSIQWPDDFDIRRGFVYVRDRAAKTEAAVRTVPVDPKAIVFVESYVADHRPSRQPGLRDLPPAPRTPACGGRLQDSPHTEHRDHELAPRGDGSLHDHAPGRAQEPEGHRAVRRRLLRRGARPLGETRVLDDLRQEGQLVTR